MSFKPISIFHNYKGLVTIAVLNTKTTELENKALDITNLARKADLNSKKIKTESKISGITNLATKVTLDSKATRTEKKKKKKKKKKKTLTLLIWLQRLLSIQKLPRFEKNT